LTALIERYGIDTILGTFEELLDYAERKTRAGIGRIPDGHYEFSGLFDTDLIDDVLRLRVAIDISGDEMRVDFAGNPPQMRAGVNAILNATRAMVYMTVRSLIDPDTPINAGVYRPIVISAPEGCIFNATAPAAVNSREDTVRQIPDMIRLALADVIPEKIQAASNGGGSSTRYGMNPRTGEPYVYGETIGCGHGARATKDGLDGVQFYPTNSANVPIEILEATQPLQVECYELVQDSGGAGKFRGGLGVRRRLKAIAHDCRVRIGNTSNIHGPRGVLGGRDGATALVEMDEGLLPLVHRTGLIEPGKWVGVVTAGGGGYGDPKLRARDDILRDLREERISLKAAREVYGYTETD
jgi:N-methylhydantoinase B